MYDAFGDAGGAAGKQNVQRVIEAKAWELYTTGFVGREQIMPS